MNTHKKKKSNKSNENEFTVLSFNIRFILDRWQERKSMVSNIITKYDVVGLQEVQVGGSRSGQSIEFANAMRNHFCEGAPCFPLYIMNISGFGTIFQWLFFSTIGMVFRDFYSKINDFVLELLLSYISSNALFHTPIVGDLVFIFFGSAWLFGNFIAIRETLKPNTEREHLLLGGRYRVAQIKHMTIKHDQEDRKVTVVNVHLSDTPYGCTKKQYEKYAQARVNEFKTVANSIELGPKDSLIILGDMNSPPEEELHDVATSLGFKSAFKEIHGHEPDHTFHQKHECHTKDIGPEECLDYIYFKGLIEVIDSQVVGDRPSTKDETLYASDHFGVDAKFRIL